MKRIPIKSVALVGLLGLLLAIPGFMPGPVKEAKAVAATTTVPSTVNTEDYHSSKYSPEVLIAEANTVYDSMRLKQFGLARQAFEYAYKGYKLLVEKGKIGRDQILSICDFSQSSKKKRLYVLDVEQKKVLVNTYVAHGRNSGGEFAESFSNTPESHKSSLGFYVTRHTYYGDHGLALKIDGLEKGINDNANERNIVVHGSRYVGASFLRNNKYNGRSFGCPAIPAKESDKIINTIQDGSVLFIYHPTKNYLTTSRILNG